jgi:short-subunit dehydrogenase
VLVNNAGFELVGAAEEIPVSQVRRQFETNVFGLARLTQLVLHGMRAQRHGRIVNVSSIFGRFAVPGWAYFGSGGRAVGRARRCRSG